MRNDAFDSKQFNENRQNYEKAIEKGEHIFLDADDLSELADYYQLHNSFDKAKEVSQYALKLFPQSDSILLLNANITLTTDGDLEEAKKYIEAVGNKNDVEYHLINAEIMLFEGENLNTDKYLQEVYHSLPKNERAPFILDVCELFIIHNYIDIAEKWHKKYLGDDEDHLELSARIHFAHADYNKCINILNSLLDNHPYEEFLWCMLAKAQYMISDFDGAISSCDFAIAIEPENSEALQIKAYTLYTLENYTDAIEYYMRYLRIFPNDIKCNEYIAFCYIQTSKPDKAIPHLLSVIDSYKEDIEEKNEVYRSLAFAYSGINETDKAIEALDNIDYDWKSAAYIDMLKGHIYLENGRKEEAINHFELAILNSTESPEILIDIALSLSDNGYYENAYKIATFYMNQTSVNDAKGQAVYALISYRLGKHQDFLMALKNAVDNDPDVAKSILLDIFPEGLHPEEYYQYAIKKKIKK